MSENTQPNPKYYIGKLFNNPLSWMASTAVVGAALITPTIEDGVMLDTIGTDQEASIIAEHQENFADLKQMRADLDYAEAHAAATGNETGLSELQESFGEKALNSYLSLYTKGASQDGAALSEENFDNLRTTFAHEIMDPETFGFHSIGQSDAGLLDETLAETFLNTDDAKATFQTAKELDNKMAEDQNTLTALTGLAGLGTAAFCWFMLHFCVSTAGSWSREDKRIPKKTARRYGQH